MKQTPFPKMDQNAGYDWNANNDPQTENQTPTPWNNHPESHSETASGNQTLMPWDKNFDLKSYLKNYKNYISDEDLYAKMWENIKQHENVIPHPYLDTKGKITIGGRANVNDWNVFKNLNATVDDMPATEAQKRAAYGRMRQLSDEKDINGNYVNRNLKASAFRDKTNIRISDAEARSLAQDHMTNDLKHLRREFDDFDDFPLPLKEVLLDVQYNVRNGVNPKDWPNLYQAIKNRDVEGIVSNVHRRDVAQRRNNWTRDKARSIRF